MEKWYGTRDKPWFSAARQVELYQLCNSLHGVSLHGVSLHGVSLHGVDLLPEAFVGQLMVAADRLAILAASRNSDLSRWIFLASVPGVRC